MCSFLVHILSSLARLPDDNEPCLQWELMPVEHDWLCFLGELLDPVQCTVVVLFGV
jgi:hypothetical protein